MTRRERSPKRYRWHFALTGSAFGALLSVAVGGTTAAQTPTNPPSETATLAAAAAPASGSQVAIENFRYSPTTLMVPLGTIVTWVNHDDDVHTVTSADGLFSSSGLETGDVFSRRFDAPGTYTYFCAVHPHMRATIIVK